MRSNFNSKYMNWIITIFLLIILYCLFYNRKVVKEDFVGDGPGVGKSFGNYYNPDVVCKNCFPGSYLRSELYQNVCDKGLALRRDKISTNFDGCLRNL